MAKPVRVLSGTVSDITGSCGLSLPSSATAISTSMVAASTGAASSSAARKMPPAARTMASAAGGASAIACPAAPRESCAPSSQQNPVEARGDHHQRAHQLKEVAQQRRLDRRGRIEQVDQRKAELQSRNLAGKQQHLVQQRQREPVDQADGQFAEQRREADRRLRLRQRRHQRRQQKRNRPTKTAFARRGSAVEEKNGAKTTIPLTAPGPASSRSESCVQSVHQLNPCHPVRAHRTVPFASA